MLGVLEEVEAVHQALAELGYPVVRVPLLPPLEQVRKTLQSLKADIVFNLFEGFEGKPETEAAVAGMLSELRLRHTGCPGPALSLALDKEKTKALLESVGIATPRHQVLSPETLASFHLSFPCIVKPRAEDASHGISEDSVVYDFASLDRQVTKVSELFGGSALVEEFVDGREFNVLVLGNNRPEVLPVSEIVYSLPPGMPRILTFAAKWQSQSLYYQHTQAHCPAEIGSELRDRIRDTALAAFRLTGCSGYARVDFRLDKEGTLKVIEMNPNPDISPSSGAARQARAAGMTYAQFIERIALLALEKPEEGARPRIRPMVEEDRPAIVEILQATPEFKPLEVEVAEEVIDEYLCDPSGSGYHILVAERGSSIIGYICYGPTPMTEGTWDLYWAAVARGEQGRGMGRILFATAEAKIREAGGRLAIIETSAKPGYERTIRMYLLLGYQVAGQIPDYYAPDDDKLILQKHLE